MNATFEPLDPGTPSPVSPGDRVADNWGVGPRYLSRGDVHFHVCVVPEDTRIAVFKYRGVEPLPRFLDALREDAEGWGAMRPVDGRMPAIVPTLDIGRIVNQTTCYWVQESPRGPSLAERLDSTPVLAPDYALKIARQAAEALRTLHTAGFIHGDLDPVNVALLGSGDWVRLAWGGLAARLEWAGMDGVRRSLAEVAPELLEGKPPSPRSDLYGVAALLFRMVAGQPPWLVRRKGPLPGVTDEDPLPPLPEWAAPLHGVLQIALQRDPERRPDTVGDWLDRLVDPENVFRDLPPPVGTWAPSMPEGPEPTPPSVNRTVLPLERVEGPDSVLSNTPPSGMPRVMPLPTMPRTVVPLEPRATTPPIVAPPEPRVVVQPPPAWWMPWVLVGGLLGVLAFFVVMFGVYAALNGAAPAPEPEPAHPAANPTPVPAAPATEPAVPQFTIQSEPSGAQVFQDGALVGLTPATLPLRGGPGSTFTFELRMEGREPQLITQSWTEDPGVTTVTLKRRPVAVAPPVEAPPEPQPTDTDVKRNR